MSGWSGRGLSLLEHPSHAATYGLPGRCQSARHRNDLLEFRCPRAFPEDRRHFQLHRLGHADGRGEFQSRRDLLLCRPAASTRCSPGRDNHVTRPLAAQYLHHVLRSGEHGTDVHDAFGVRPATRLSQKRIAVYEYRSESGTGHRRSEGCADRVHAHGHHHRRRSGSRAGEQDLGRLRPGTGLHDRNAASFRRRGARALSQAGAVFSQIQSSTIDRNTGLPLSYADASGAKTFFVYDALGRPTKVTPPASTEAPTIDPPSVLKSTPQIYSYRLATAGRIGNECSTSYPADCQRPSNATGSVRDCTGTLNISRVNGGEMSYSSTCTAVPLSPGRACPEVRRRRPRRSIASRDCPCVNSFRIP